MRKGFLFLVFIALAIMFSSKFVLVPTPISSQTCYPKKGMKPIKVRVDMPFLLEDMGLKTGVEVGVKAGIFSKIMLTGWKSCERYHLVDVWKHQENYVDIANVGDERQEKIYAKAQHAVKDFQEKVVFHRMLSVEAAKKFGKESLDFAYIDARHDYCGVLEDLEHYYPLIKPGGVIAGNDYLIAADTKDGQDWGLCMNGTRVDSSVKGAVDDFFIAKGLTISVTYATEHQFRDWMVHKPLC